jgi:hypothetical protein
MMLAAISFETELINQDNTILLHQHQEKFKGSVSETSG